jgi:hypothetical protein
LSSVKIPDSTRRSLASRLADRARERWPDLAGVDVRFRANFAYVDGVIADGPTIPLCRLRYGGSASSWGFAIYLASRDGYEDSVLPSGHFLGSPEEALDCACGLYLAAADLWRLGGPDGPG